MTHKWDIFLNISTISCFLNAENGNENRWGQHPSWRVHRHLFGIFIFLLDWRKLIFSLRWNIKALNKYFIEHLELWLEGSLPSFYCLMTSPCGVKKVFLLLRKRPKCRHEKSFRWVSDHFLCIQFYHADYQRAFAPRSFRDFTYYKSPFGLKCCVGFFNELSGSG